MEFDNPAAIIMGLVGGAIGFFLSRSMEASIPYAIFVAAITAVACFILVSKIAEA